MNFMYINSFHDHYLFYFLNNNKFLLLYDYIGAIDGTHISAWVPTDIQTNFRGIKQL